MIAESRIALAVPADVQAIARLSREAVEHGLAWSWTPPRVMRSLADPATTAVVARQGGRLLGFTLLHYGDDEAHLLLLAVQAGQRRRGIGSALLQWLEPTLRVAGLASVQLEVRQASTAARSFYRRHGYVETGRLAGYYQGVEDAICMRRDLRRAP